MQEGARNPWVSAHASQGQAPSFSVDDPFRDMVAPLWLILFAPHSGSFTATLLVNWCYRCLSNLDHPIPHSPSSWTDFSGNVCLFVCFASFWIFPQPLTNSVWRLCLTHIWQCLQTSVFCCSQPARWKVALHHDIAWTCCWSIWLAFCMIWLIMKCCFVWAYWQTHIILG